MTNADRKKRVSFVCHCQNRPEGTAEYLSKIIFSDEYIFRLNGAVNTQNVRIWDMERPTEGR